MDFPNLSQMVPEATMFAIAKCGKIEKPGQRERLKVGHGVVLDNDYNYGIE
jgi:hypothetical protein